MDKEVMLQNMGNFDDEAFKEIKQILDKARSAVYKSINSEMVRAYLAIGKMIAEKIEGKAKYGDYFISSLADQLTKEYGKGFTATNLRYMRQVYLAFSIHHTACDELSWSHLRLLSKIESVEERDFYVKECISCNWSVRQLDRQINSLYFQRLLSSQHKDVVRNEIATLETGVTANDIIKDPYVLEFVGLKENRDYLESELESSLIENLEKFLLELGKGYSFVARQKRITDDGEHYYIDLVFYNYILKCFVLIDLKAAKLTHKDIGQMDFYVRYYDAEVRTESDNPTIGIILCTDKSSTLVKYSMLNENAQLFASKYKLYLPTEEELRTEIERQKLLLETKE